MTPRKAGLQIKVHRKRTSGQSAYLDCDDGNPAAATVRWNQWLIQINRGCEGKLNTRWLAG
jgi:hypothetical protein